MQIRAYLLLALLGMGALAGCLDEAKDDDGNGPLTDKGGWDATPVDSPDWAIRALYAGDNPAETEFTAVHDHSDREVHKGLSTVNFDLAGWDPLVTGYHGASAGGYYCGEVSVDGDRKLAVVNSFTSATAIAVIDVTEPDNPIMVGELNLPRTHVYDAAITDDGQFAILATSPLAAISHGDGSGTKSYTERPVFTDRCGFQYQGPEDELPFASGTLLVDLRTPEVPAVADFVPGPALGPHSVSSQTIDGVTYATASITNLVYSVSYFDVFTVEILPVLDQGKLVPYSAYSANYVTDDVVSGLALLNGHVDATLVKHSDGRLLGLLANWDGGLLIVDFSLPVPTLVAEYGNSQSSHGASSGSIHTAYVVGEREGRFLIVIGQEVGGSFNQEGNRRPTGQMTLLDIANPEAPEALARWTMPVYIRWSGALHFSTHYPAVVGDVLYVSTYHGGLWAADMREENWPEMPTIGVYIPSTAEGEGPVTDTAYAPYVLDVLALENGNVLTFDGTGAYSLNFDPEDTRVVPAAPWTEDAWL